MGDYLIGTQLHIRKLAEGRLERAYKLGLELAVELIAGVLPLNIAADIGVEKQRICDLVRIHARAAHGHIDIKADLAVNDAERDGIGRAELIVDKLLEIKVIHTLILGGVAAVGKALADGLECFLYAAAEAAGENGRLGRCIVCKLARLCADLDDLALLDNDHALTVGNGNARAVGDDVVIPPGVRRAAAGTLLSLCDKHILGYRFAVEKFLPLVCQCAAYGTDACFDKSHCIDSFRLYMFV